jgi:RNA polymerase sigma factor (sigma-70 family)
MFEQSPRNDLAAELQGSPIWSAAYRKYFRLWTNLARGGNLTEDEAKDIVHSVLLSILADPSRTFDSMEHARNYVAKSVLNRVKVIRLRNARRVVWEDAHEIRVAVIPNDVPGDDLLRQEALTNVLRKLARRDFNILKLRFYCGFTLSQSSEILGIPLSTIKSRETVILRKIRERLRKNGF